ncbi:MAG TPA: DUF4430 domain-containing protein [Bacillota bacterium]|nr:DUF4430 domain-containing protein [Bacillota bacterium]
MKYRLLFFIFLLVVIFYITNTRGTNQVTVTISMDHHQNQIIEKKLPLKDDRTVLDIMVHYFDVQTIFHGEVFTSINGIKNNEKDKLGWFYTVNGKEPMVTPRELKLKPGDHIEFDYHHYYSPN